MKTRKELPMLFEKHKLTGIGAEIGVQNGYFSLCISQGYSGAIFSIDIWPDESVYETAKNVLQDSRCVLIKANSTEVAKVIQDESLDFIYIDAGHSYEEVKADFNAWFPKVRKGGIVSGHDYGVNDCIGVKQFLDEKKEKEGLKFELTTDDYWEGREYQSWWFIK